MEKLISLNFDTLQFFGNRPEAITTQGVSLQMAVASHPDTPGNLLEILVNSDAAEVAEAARLHVNYAGELTGSWQDASDEQLKSRYIGQNDRLAVELLKIAPVPVYFLSEYVPANYLIQGLNNPHLPLRYRLQLLTRLAQEPTLEPRLQAAESPDISQPVLEQLIGDLELPIRIAVQYNPNCPPELVELVTGQHEVASNWDTDPQQLDNLSNSNWNCIRLAVAQNPSAAEETLLKLAKDKVFKIQLAVAKNPITPARVLSVLAEHSNQEIQVAVARHPNATEEILQGLFPSLHRIIKSRENLPASILERIFNESSKDPQVPLFLSKSGADISFFYRQPNTPNWILAEFADVDLEKLRTYAESNYKKSPIKQGVEGWIGDRCSGIIEVAKHPQVSVEVLEKLTEFPNQRVKLAVAQNQKTPEELRLHLLEELLENENAGRIKATIAADINTPIAILEKLAGELSSISQVFIRLSNIIPNTSQSLINKIIDFIDRHQSPEQILFWLRQDPAFGDPILQDWHQVVNSLDEVETLQLKAMSMMMMPAIGLNGGIHRRDRNWLNRGLNKSRVNLTDLQNLPPTYILYALLLLLRTFYQSDSSSKAIVAALLGNPSTPASIRDRLWSRYREKFDDSSNKDVSLKLAIAFNPAVEANQRREYLEQTLSSGYSSIREAIAKNPLTPTDILERIASRGVGGLQQVVKNPNCPVHLLQQTIEQVENSSGLSHTLVEVAKNSNTPVALLKEFALSKGKYGVVEAVLKNPNLDRQTVYEIQLEIETAKETQQANQILVKRTDSPYALAKVLETSDRNAKLSAARNRKTPIQVLEQLAKDEDEWVEVRRAVANNPNASQSIRDALQDLLPVAKTTNQTISPTLRGLSRIYNPDTDDLPIVLSEYADSEVAFVRFVSLLHSLTPVEILREGSQSVSWIERYAVADNPATPTEIKQQLTRDSNRIVRAVAMNNLAT